MDEYRKIEVSVLGASTVDQRYLLTCGERHFEANAMVVGLLRMLQEAPDETTAIADYVLHCGGCYSEEQVEAFVVTYLRPIAIGADRGRSVSSFTNANCFRHRLSIA